MFKKLHYQLTAICTLCTAIIVIVITVLCLYVSEKGQAEKEYGLFLTKASSVYSHLQIESTFTMEWFQTSVENGNFILWIEANGLPLSFSKITTSDSEKSLIQSAKETAANSYQLDITNPQTSKVVSKQVDFLLISEDNAEYYAALAFIPRDTGYVSMTLLHPLSPFYESIVRQRILFGIIIFIAILCLGIFSYLFTGLMIKPIEKSKEQQIQFIAAASHELRSPLTVIRSSISAKKKADIKKSKRFDSIINSELIRMGRLIEDMLSLSRSDTASWALQLEKVCMPELILTVYESFLSIAEEQSITLAIELDQKKHSYCMADKLRIQQVLVILLDNALSYTQENGTVLIISEKRKRKYIIKIIDDGKGISDREKEHIFERFYRADSSRSNKEHFGLGLSIALEIIKIHKGTISVSDTNGGGSTFQIQLPLWS